MRSPICTSAPRMRTAGSERGEHRAGDAAGGDAGGGLARRGAAAAAVVAQAVLQVVGEVGVAGAELLRDLAIVLRPLVGVADQERDRRAGGPALEGAGEDLDLVGLLPLGGEAALPRPAGVEPGLDVGLGQRDARRAAVDDAAERRPVALAPGGDAEEVAEAVDDMGAPLCAGLSAPAARREAARRGLRSCARSEDRGAQVRPDRFATCWRWRPWRV